MDAKNWWIAAKSSPEGEPLWLPLDYHLNDTAYVIDDLVKNWLPGAVYREIGLKRNECRKVAKFLALTHDIGKATPAFQKKILPMIPEMELHQTKAGYTLPAGLLDQNAIPHAHMGEALLRQREIDKTLTVIVGAHHGKPDNDIDSQDLEVYLEEYHRHFGYGDKNWMELQQHLICQALRNAGYDSKEELPELSEPAQMILTGLLIMADWIASNTYYFPLIPLDSDIREYDTGRSVRALKKLKLPEPCMMSDYWCEPEFYNERFGFTPNMIQTTMKNIAAGVSEPGILILEAPMGEGKTEGALAAAEVLMNRFDLGGVAFFFHLRQPAMQCSVES